MGIFTAIMAALKGAKWVATAAKYAGFLSPALAAIKTGWKVAKKHWKAVLPVLFFVALVAVFWSKNREIRGLEAQVSAFEQGMESVDAVLVANRKEMNRCIAINNANALDLANARVEAEQAVLRIQLLNDIQNEQVEVIHEEATELRGKDVNCRTIDDPLPDWFDQWLRNGHEGNTAVRSENSYSRPIRPRTYRTNGAG